MDETREQDIDAMKNTIDRPARAAEIDKKIRAASARRTLYGALLAHKLKLHQVDLECLFLITLNRDVTPGKLAEETGLTTGAITGLVDRIERAGFVRRRPDPNDRRRTFLEPIDEKIAEIRAINSSAYDFWLGEILQYDDAALDIIEDFAERNYDAAVQATQNLRALDMSKD